MRVRAAVSGSGVQKGVCSDGVVMAWCSSTAWAGASCRADGAGRRVVASRGAQAAVSVKASAPAGSTSRTTRSGRSRTASARPPRSQSARVPSSPICRTGTIRAPSPSARARSEGVGGTAVRTAKESPSSRRGGPAGLRRSPRAAGSGCPRGRAGGCARRTRGLAGRAPLRPRPPRPVTPGTRQIAPTAARRSAAARSCPPVMAQPVATARRITWRACGLRSCS